MENLAELDPAQYSNTAKIIKRNWYPDASQIAWDILRKWYECKPMHLNSIPFSKAHELCEKKMEVSDVCNEFGNAIASINESVTPTQLLLSDRYKMLVTEDFAPLKYAKNIYGTLRDKLIQRGGNTEINLQDLKTTLNEPAFSEKELGLMVDACMLTFAKPPHEKFYRLNIDQKQKFNEWVSMYFGFLVQKPGSRVKIEEGNYETAFFNYKILEEVDRGGNGIVYKVENERKDVFALKILNPENDKFDSSARFKNEIYFLLRHKNQNLIELKDYGFTKTKTGKQIFYVMPYYKDNFRKVMNLGLRYDLLMEYFTCALKGVMAAHEEKIAHRDLKPENMLVDTTSKRLVVSDFGIAQFAEGKIATVHSENDRLANFPYASPEQRDGKGEVTYLTDIYSLGYILNEMFTGNRPDGSGYKTIAQVDNKFAYLDQLVERMINNNPANRPQSLAEVLEFIETKSKTPSPKSSLRITQL